MKRIIIGTRGSELALWQARYVQLELRRTGIESTIEIIKTKGDQIQHLGFDKMEGKGFFTKEIEDALHEKKIDLAVHSHKDLETSPPEGLVTAAVSYREDPRDLLLIRREAYDLTQRWCVAEKAVVGTSSARRKSQLLSFRPDLQPRDLRGNVMTRLQKLREGQFDAIMLAKAGAERLQLDLSEFHVETLDPRLFIPAPAQGVLAIQVRAEDAGLIEALRKINHSEVEETIGVERSLLQQLDGGCQMPMGALCLHEQDTFKLWATVAPAWNGSPRRVYLEAPDSKELAAKAFSLLTRPVKRSVFISRSLQESDYFTRILHHAGYEIESRSLTRYEKVPFQTVPPSDWIFFSSKNCVRFFFEQQPVLPEHIRIGSIGGATAEALKQRGIASDFTGYSNDTAAIGKEFARMLNGYEQVLFPQSTASYRTVQKQFGDQKNLIDLVVYDTLPDEKAEIPDTDVVVLTSPTNALLYLRKKTPRKEQRFIAIGKSTAEVLRQQGLEAWITPWNTSEAALADAVMSLE